MSFEEFIRARRIVALGISVAVNPEKIPPILTSYLNNYFSNIIIVTESEKSEFKIPYSFLNENIEEYQNTLFIHDNCELFLLEVKRQSLIESLKKENHHIIITSFGLMLNDIKILKKMNVSFAFFAPTNLDVKFDSLLISSEPNPNDRSEYESHVKKALIEKDDLISNEHFSRASRALGLKNKSTKLRNLALQIITKPLKRHFVRVEGEAEDLMNLFLNTKISNIEDIFLLRFSDSEEDKHDILEMANKKEKIIFISDYSPEFEFIPNDIGAFHITDGGRLEDLQTIKDILSASKYHGTYPRKFEILQHVSLVDNSPEIKRYHQFNMFISEVLHVYNKLCSKRKVYINDKDLFVEGV